MIVTLVTISEGYINVTRMQHIMILCQEIKLSVRDEHNDQGISISVSLLIENFSMLNINIILTDI